MDPEGTFIALLLTGVALGLVILVGALGNTVHRIGRLNVTR
jgi:hypothetical protein